MTQEILTLRIEQKRTLATWLGEKVFDKQLGVTK